MSRFLIKLNVVADMFIIFAIVLSFSVFAAHCPTHSNGDANCSGGKPDLIDYEIWRREYLGILTTRDADFNGSNAKPDLIDYETWRRAFIGTTTNPPPPPANPPPANPPPPQTTNQLNQLLEAYRNSNPGRYERFATIPSAQLPLNQLIEAGSPDPEFFVSNGSPGSNGQAGQFRTICDFSHFNYDDPIFFPGRPGAAHLHMYFGNTRTNAYSTADSIVNSGGSTCDGQELNRTSYWFPALLDAQGRPRIPNNFIMYYKTQNVNMPPGGYSEMPPGLKMIALNPNSSVPQQLAFNNGWHCGGGLFSTPTSALIPNCSPPNKLSLKISFPRCWDGKNLDSPDHRSHVVYASAGTVGGSCPPTHPKIFSTAEALFEWDLDGSTAGWYLSSDRMAGRNYPGGTTMHGDWYGGWHVEVMKAWTQDCLNTEWNCQTSLLGNKGRPLALPGGAINLLKSTTQKYDAIGPVIVNRTFPPDAGMSNALHDAH